MPKEIQICKLGIEAVLEKKFPWNEIPLRQVTFLQGREPARLMRRFALDD